MSRRICRIVSSLKNGMRCMFKVYLNWLVVGKFSFCYGTRVG